MSSDSRDVSGLFVIATLAFVERALGPGARAEVLTRVGLREQDCATNGEWVSTAETLALARVASDVTGDVDIGWRVGEELIRQSAESGLAEFLRGAGTVANAFDNVADYGSRMSSGRTNRVVERTHERVVIESRYEQIPTTNFFCRLQAGYYAGLPSLFGGAGVATEPSCQLRGDGVCRFVVTWADAGVDEGEVRAAISRGDAIVQQFEDLEEMASELASARDTEAALERIMARVGTATMAPRFLLIAQMTPSVPVRVHARGFRPDDIPAARDAVEQRSSSSTPWGTPVVVEVRGQHSYACLAAFVPEGTEPSEAEQRLLRAYAGHAASVLETAHALECARKDRDTAHVLLQLAHSLARTQTPEDVSATITRATRDLINADYVTGWLWDSDECVLRLAASEPELPSDMPTSFNTVQAPALLALRAHPRPILLPAHETNPMNADLMERLNVQTAAYVPIVARDDLLGLVAVGLAAPTCDLRDTELLTRLAGLADFASAALDNARLLERVQHEASHDALTGLPNRTAIIGDALRRPTGRESGLLFIDLDNFKQVNDIYGHHIGDQLLALIATRMNGCMRPTDTLARFAGDEFVVAVTDCTDRADLEEVARRIRAALEHPMIVDDQVITISASIGIAHAPDDGSDFESLLNAADLAMYHDKRQKPRDAEEGAGGKEPRWLETG